MHYPEGMDGNAWAAINYLTGAIFVDYQAWTT